MDRGRLALGLVDDEGAEVTYAEQFNAPSWLEEPARWLWWAFQSMQARNLGDADYNLRQFWAALEPVKAQADVSTWPEIMALDSVSHKYAADLTTAQLNAMAADANNWGAWLFGPVVNEVWSVEENKRALQNQRTQELQKAADLAAQANTAQAKRVQAVAMGALSQDEYERKLEDKSFKSILAGPKLELMGVPLWAWAAGAVALYLMVKR